MELNKKEFFIKTLLNETEYSCLDWYNAELIGKCKVLGKTDIYKL